MDWTRAIDRNRAALLRVLAILSTAAGLTQGGTVVAFPRHVRYAMLRLIRPTESATRRLIVIVARIMTEKGRSVASPPTRTAPSAPIPSRFGDPKRPPSFPLFDPRKRFTGALQHPKGPEPRITAVGFDDPVFPDHQGSSLDDPAYAQRLCRRLQTLKRALDDLPGQARRLARWRARQNVAHRSPMRPGRPPGHRARPIHEVDEILTECHTLAHRACSGNVMVFKTEPPPRNG